ncbi:MAG TPA: LamG domain-containing protein [Sedimentisphaerales bacterium]|nr:LamG domain-containing protein [Sedimentisphaerales bacterium]
MSGKSTIRMVSIFMLAVICSAAFGADPVGWWKFDEGSGSTAYDSSGHGYNGSIEGTTSWVTGAVGPYALRLTSGYVVIGDRSALRPSRLTVCAWVNLPGPQADFARLLVKGNDNSESYNFQFSGYYLHFGSQDTGGGGHGVGLTNPLWPDDWIFVAGVYDGSNMILYVNGEPDNSAAVGSFTPIQDDGPLVIGARAPDMDRRMNGSVDDVRVYNYGLSPAEIHAIYWAVRDPSLAGGPNPDDLDEDVRPDVVLMWSAGQAAVSHDVYLGTDFDDVNNATSSSHAGVIYDNVDVNYYDPSGLLEFGVTYYWRIDEVGSGETLRGAIWSFTTDDGKARNPNPADGSFAPLETILEWAGAPLATSHDVYFGRSLYDVGEFATPVSAGQTDTFYNPGPLVEASNYYWRIDERGPQLVKGDIWGFSTAGGLHLKVDLGLPQCFDGGAVVITDPPVEGTVKEGWWGFVASRWADMYMHDAVWERGENGEGPPPDTDGIAGSGVHVAIGCGGVGDGGFHVYNMCRDNLGGDGCPTGSPVGGAIANGWYHDVDWGGEATGDILLRINGLPPGEYILISYHNHWEPCSQGTRNCLNCYSHMPNMPAVTAQSLPVSGLPEYGSWNFTPGTGVGVTAIQNDYDIDVSCVTEDEQVSTSTIRFHTDGNDVLVIYDGGDNTYPDPARPDREGSKAILNAFEIIAVAPDEPEQPTASNPSPTQGAEDVDPDAVLSWTPGEGAIWHDVYLGTDFILVRDANTASAVHRATLGGAVNSYDPCGLEPGGTYFWRIDESNGVDTYTGSVWYFTVRDYILVDDMESYDETNDISETWLGYPYPDTDNYAFVYLEQSTVHGGQKSMLFYYDAWFGTYFTATRIFASPRNWNLPGVNHLSLWFHGYSYNMADDRMYVVLKDDAGHAGTVMYDGDANDITKEQWLEWNIPLEDFGDQGADLSQVEELIIGVDSEWWAGVIYFDDVRLYGTRCIAEYAPTADVTGNCMVDLEDFAVLGSQWLGPPATPSADIAPNPADGWVDGLDLAVLAGQWLEIGLFPPE